MNKQRKVKSIAAFVILTVFFLLNQFVGNSQEINGKNNPDEKKMGFQGFIVEGEFQLNDLTYDGLQKLIDSVSSSGGGIINIPTGVIEISKPLQVKSNIKLLGTLGPNNTRKTEIKCVANAELGANGAIVIRGQKNVTIENLIIDVNNCHAMGIGAIYGTSNFLISNNEVKNMGTPKINCVSGEKEILPHQDNPTGINMWETDGYFTICNNHVMNAAKHGINANMNVETNNFRGNYIIRDNRIENCFMGIDVSSNGYHIEVYNNEISNCIFGVKIVNSHYVHFYSNKIYDLDNKPYYWGGEWGDDSGEALILQNNVDEIIIENNILVSYPGMNQIVKWDVPDNAVITISNNSDKLD